jgi:hypothetical protein
VAAWSDLAAVVELDLDHHLAVEASRFRLVERSTDGRGELGR